MTPVWSTGLPPFNFSSSSLCEHNVCITLMVTVSCSVRFHTPSHMYPGPPSSSSPGQPLQMPLVQSNSEVLLPTISGRLQNADSKSSHLTDSKTSHLYVSSPVFPLTLSLVISLTAVQASNADSLTPLMRLRVLSRVVTQSSQLSHRTTVTQNKLHRVSSF